MGLSHFVKWDEEMGKLRIRSVMKDVWLRPDWP